MTYGRFAYLYDELMKDVPYDLWVEKVIQTLKTNHQSSYNLLDVGCGTGQLSIRFAEAGFHVTGIDLSEDMLSVAHAKTTERGLSIPYFQQNMMEMEGLGQFDVITIFCDSLNYLENEDQVLQTFQRVYDHLQPDGVLLFDVHSLYKMSEVFQNHTFALNDEEISYIWFCYEGKSPNSVEHDLSFFVLDPVTGKYDRIDEVHFQRTFPISQYEQWLNDVGFEVVEISADFQKDQPEHQSERIFFTAKKRIM
jgi:ubiquinone/menaquinone biosynthesis C-methylase UbiE